VKKDAKGNPIVKRYSQQRLNVRLPKQDIVVIYRADSSGTSGILTNFLRAAVPNVWTKNGNNAFDASFPGQINAPANIGKIQSARGSELVAQLAAKTPGAITYAEKDYASKNKLSFAKLYNNADVAVDPGAAGTSAFLGSATFNENNGTIVLDYKTTNPAAYLLGSTSYALVLTNYKDKEKAAAVKKLMTFILDECAKRFPETEFAVIDGPLYDFNKKLIGRIG
ncbi:MAG: hypothetical protein RL540_1265, partial [Actinomycetota bacterium]